MTTHTCRYCGTAGDLQESTSAPGVYACQTCVNVPTKHCHGCGKHVTQVEVVVVRFTGQRAERCTHCTHAQKVNGL
jgi:hypothetical protein